MSAIRSLLHKLLNFPRTMWKFILDAFFPITCLGCGTFDRWICAQCHGTLPILTEQHCPFCTVHITQNGEVCPPCMIVHHPPYDGVFVASYYKDPLVRAMIHHFKYRFIRQLAHPIALLLAQALQNSHMPVPDMIVPVPLHPRRRRWRGFNQAEEIAHTLDLQIPVNAAILKRVRYTTAQVTMRDKKSRLANVIDAFTVSDASVVHGKNILLIDDVITTGATITACAHALKNAGAKSVYGLVIARE